MPVIEIADDFQLYRFDGELITEPVSTARGRDGRQRPRWLEAALYGRAAGGYVIVQQNLSLVWHLPGGAGHVRKPARVLAPDLPEAAVYCGTIPPKPGREGCPLQEAPVLADPFGSGGARLPAIPPEVVTELPQRKVLRGADADAIIRQVATMRRRGRGTASMELSAPMRELFTRAAQADPAFAGKVVVDL